METASAPDRELTFYSERNSVEIRNDVSQLFEEPLVNLSPEQLQEVHQFAQSVYDGEFSGIKRESDKNLEELQGMSLDAFVQQFYLGYFLTPQGKEDRVKMGIKSRPQNKIIDGLGDIQKIDNHVDSKTRKRIAKNSLDWHKAQIVNALENPGELDAAQIDDDSVEVNYNPAKLLEKVTGLAAHRRFYRQVKLDIKSEADSPAKMAKMLELEMNMARANNILAGLLDDVLNLGEQLINRPQDEQAAKWLHQIEELTPVIYRALTRDRDDKLQGLQALVSRLGRVAKRLPIIGGSIDGDNVQRQSMEEFEANLARRTDYLMQGVAWGEDGKLTSISQDTIEFAAEVIRENEAQETAIEPIFDQEVVNKLKATKWNAQQFKDFCEDILRKWEILSNDQADSEADERDGPAADNKWQIIINPKKDSIGLDRNKKLFKVPETFERNLIKSLTIAAHELTHVAQAECDTALSEAIPLAVVGGRRISAMREGGAVDQEAKVYAMLGERRPTRVGYLSALQAKLGSGNVVQVARAFYEAYEDETKLSDEEKHENRKLAADRALRLYRNGGYNTQPLDYVEGDLTKRVLREASPLLIESIMIASASFSLRDQTRLHQAGLYNAPTTTNFHPAIDVEKTFREGYLESILAASA